MNQNEKKAKLDAYLKSLGSVAVAFSGGVDSTFLLRCAHDALGQNAVAVTACSVTYPMRELEAAKAFCRGNGIRHEVITSEEIDIPGFADNPPNRCYLCKQELFTKIRAAADRCGVRYIAEGSNCDDLSDYRPGLKAARDMGVLSPLRLAQLTKDDIRALSKEIGLPTWNKPSMACLSSRIPYGEKITRAKLDAVDKGEQYLRGLGFRQVRVRHHGPIARIELGSGEMARVFTEGLADRIDRAFRTIGFTYVTLDLGGYHTGSMNAVLSEDVIDSAKVESPAQK